MIGIKTQTKYINISLKLTNFGKLLKFLKKIMLNFFFQHPYKTWLRKIVQNEEVKAV